jgi:hypothetical protein
VVKTTGYLNVTCIDCCWISSMSHHQVTANRRANQPAVKAVTTIAAL